MPMFKHVCSIRLLQSLQHTVTSALQLYCKHYYNTSMSDHALAHIGRRHYVSISGLSHVLKEIKAHFNEHGILPESDSRQMPQGGMPGPRSSLSKTRMHRTGRSLTTNSG